MPHASEILAQLERLANQFGSVALVWHLLLLSLAAAALLGRAPSQRALARLAALPAASVGALAWYVGNPVNGAVFTALALAMMGIAGRRPSAPLELAPPLSVVFGCLTLAYGLVYPHFVQVDTVWAYALFAPVGVVPCPTLALLAGTGLLFRSFGSRPWALLLSLTAATYACFGLFVLGVWLDAGLLVAACLMLAQLPKRKASSALLGDERQRIDDFLAARRIALVGASTDASSFSRAVLNELIAHGIDVVPVHPSASEIAGRRAFPNVAAIEPAVEAALIMTPAAASAGVVDACAAAGIAKVWLHRGAGQGAVSSEAVEVAARRGLSCVVGRCPLMFLGPRPAAVHRVHAAALRLVGDYPRR